MSTKIKGILGWTVTGLIFITVLTFIMWLLSDNVYIAGTLILLSWIWGLILLLTIFAVIYNWRRNRVAACAVKVGAGAKTAPGLGTQTHKRGPLGNFGLVVIILLICTFALFPVIGFVLGVGSGNDPNAKAASLTPEEARKGDPVDYGTAYPGQWSQEIDTSKVAGLYHWEGKGVMTVRCRTHRLVSEGYVPAANERFVAEGKVERTFNLPYVPIEGAEPSLGLQNGELLQGLSFSSATGQPVSYRLFRCPVR